MNDGLMVTRRPARNAIRRRLMVVLGLSVVLVGLLPGPVQAGWLTNVWPGYDAAPNSEAARVLEIARAQLGKQYRYAGIGPDYFDCSGLVWYVFREAGLRDRIGNKRRGALGYLNWFKANGRISHNLADARAGDILIWGNGRHAGIYISGNWAISALNARYDIRIHRADPMGLPFTAVLLVPMTRNGPDATPSDSPDPNATPTPTPDPNATPAPTPTAAPAAGPMPPTSVDALAQPGLQVALSWNAGTGDATPLKYRIYRNGYFLATTRNLSYVNSLWLPGRYKWQIQTVDANGLRSFRSVGVWLNSYVDGTPTDVVDTTPPTMPTGLTTQSLGDRQVALSWQPSTDSGPTDVGYIVMRGSKPVARVSTPGYVDQPAKTGTFSYSVIAYDGYGNFVRTVRVDGVADW